jgi:5-methylcytosine-specific restriction endonuclease McrA
VYCGSVKQLTLDHVIPKSRGGKNTWNNLVTCCFTCNLKKGNKTPDEAKMVMRTQPHTLNILTENSFLNKLWEEYQKSFIY